MDFKERIIVIGGGIAGLAAAYFAVKKIQEDGLDITVTLLEADDRLGGKILTERVDGYVIEGGPDTFLATKPWGLALARALGLEGRLHGTNPHKKNTYVMKGGRLTPLPEGLTMMIPTRFSPMLRTSLLSWPQKARMGLDFLLPPRSLNGEESLGNFISRRLGRAAYERLIEPLMSGIYAGDGDKLSLTATFPYLRDMETKHGGLIKGALAARRQMAARSNGRSIGKGSSRSIFLTPTTGLAELVERLVSFLELAGAEVRTGAAVSRVTRHGQGYQIEMQGGEPIEALGIVLAAPSFAAGAILQDLDANLAAELNSIEYTSTATISMAYLESDLPRSLDGYGYVIPRREGRRALACTWTSTKFPHRAPEGKVLLRVFAGRAGQEDDIPWDDAGLVELARDEVYHTLGITAVPQLVRVFRWDKAMPQYNVGHSARLERIDRSLEAHPGIALAGNGYRGIGIPDCIHSGELAAHQVIESIREGTFDEVR
jgi:protoporphyrinogen/coproporphyrinogen III oxidase